MTRKVKQNVQTVIIDDDKGVLFLNELMIKKSSFTKHIHPFARAKEALEYFESDKADDLPYIVFLDINMPEMNGWEFLEHLEKTSIDNEIYVVMVTSSIHRADKERAKKFSRVVHYVEKPLNITRLNEIKKIDCISHLFADQAIQAVEYN